MKTKWICGLYCRLSVEDSNNRESNSIQSQKIILNKFVEGLSDAEIGKIYVDDGFSGSNFDRPDFINMINDIEKGAINCVIVKDYSRFGRDYIDVGYYIEKYFPRKNIRFISVNDNHDSLNKENHDDLKMPIMNMFNDIQSRETSKKVRSGLKARKQEGKFIGAFAAYGYLKSSTDKNKLIIDDNIAPIIRQIFKWRVEGYSTYAINRKLNELKIPTPTTYKNSIGINHNPANVKSKDVIFWNETTVRKILNNEVYIGHVVQNKRTTKNHRTKEIIELDKSKWIRVENTHEPIIDLETWEKVQSMVRKRTRVSSKDGEINIFSGLVKCADCGCTMVKKNNGKGYNSFTCTTHRSDKTKCSTHSISESVLKECILKTILFQVKLAIDLDEIIKSFNENEKKNSNLKIFEKLIEDIVGNIEIKEKLLKELYFDLKKELLTESQYLNFKRELESELNALEIQLCNIKKENNKQNKKNLVIGELNIESIISNIESTNILTREMVNELIECIYVNNDKSLKIDFKFANELEEFKSII